MISVTQRLQQALQKRRRQGALRTRRQRSTQPGKQDFSSNDYLALAGDQYSRQAVIEQVSSLGFGSTGSQYLSGYTSAHAALEAQLADFIGAEAVLLFSSGYLANVGCLAALADRKHTVLADKLVHASILDGLQLSKAELKRFRHNDLQDLYAKAATCQPVLTAVEGRYSMDGDAVPLADVLAMGAALTGLLYLDDAHAFGITGPNGRGSLASLDRSPEGHVLMMAGFGKAVGTAGAFVAGSGEVVEFLRQFARTAIYSTALPISVVVASSINLTRMQQDEWRREKLFENIDYFRRQTAGINAVMAAADGPIQTLLTGDNQRCVQISEQLAAIGLTVPAIRPPTVPPGTARLRISLTASHDKADIRQLAQALKQLLAE